MKLISKGPWIEVNQFNVKRRRDVIYSARFFDEGRYVTKEIRDVYSERPDGEWMFRNTAKNVSYIDELRKAVR